MREDSGEDTGPTQPAPASREVKTTGESFPLLSTFWNPLLVFIFHCSSYEAEIYFHQDLWTFNWVLHLFQRDFYSRKFLKLFLKTEQAHIRFPTATGPKCVTACICEQNIGYQGSVIQASRDCLIVDCYSPAPLWVQNTSNAKVLWADQTKILFVWHVNLLGYVFAAKNSFEFELQ